MKFRHLRSLMMVVLYLALNVAAWFLTIPLATKLLARLIPLIPTSLKEGVFGIVLDVTLQLLLFSLWLFANYLLCRLVMGKEAPGISATPPKPRPVPKPPVLPVQTVSATVFDKHIRTKRSRGCLNHKYFAGFRLEDGSELWLSVTFEEYRRLSKDAQGQLTFQGKALRSFQQDGEAQYPEA